VRRLIRTTDIAGFRRAVVRLATAGPLDGIRRRLVVVPTRASVELLRQTIERGLSETPAAVLPDLATRDEWMSRWMLALPDAPRVLSRVEREVLMTMAAEATAARPRMKGAPFKVRPGLIGAMLDFYDELLRRQRTVGRLRRELIRELKGERGFDRGSESLIHQTAFLVLTFLRYERAVEASGGVDEHGCLRQFLAPGFVPPHTHIVVAVADHPSDPRGLWPSDFDLLGRCPSVHIDVVVTDELHDAGFRERLERELPGIVEEREPGRPWTPSVVKAPEDAWCWVSRDREEEVRDVARIIRQRTPRPSATLAPTALVVQRPLPYLYLTRQILSDARIPCQALDALPLAGEPYAALLDLVLVVARTGGTRESVTALLRSPWLRIDVDETPVSLPEVTALDAVLMARRATSLATHYLDEVDRFFDAAGRRDGIDATPARRGARAAVQAALALDPFRSAESAAAQLQAISSFLRAFERGPAPGAEWRESSLRARGAVLGALDALADACLRHDDRHRSPEALVALIRHRIEGQTFAPARDHAGVHLVDAVAARFGEFEHVHVLGLVDTDWPERQRRNIFYTSGLLKSLGWPQDSDHAAAQLAAFRDLAGLPSATLHLHAFQLDADAVVGLSPMVDVVRGLPSIAGPPLSDAAVFDDEVLTGDLAAEGTLEAVPLAWLGVRAARPALSSPAYRGQSDPQPPQQYRVSRVDRYVTCPFQYFAASVLRLPEERDDSAGLTPLERGTLLHDLFERFYREWQAAGYGAITPALLPDAVARFTALASTTLAGLPEADRVLEETRLLGSLVARGVAERVFELEAESGDEVSERLLEQKFIGPFQFPVLSGLKEVTVAINGKADRVDVLTDGRLRVIDYKLGRMPDLTRSIQIAAYAHAVQQQLEAADGRAHPIAAASYLAFGDEYKLEGAIGAKGESAAAAVQARAEIFADIVGRIEQGQFPPRPKDTGECEWCRYSGVCRKEYAWEDDAAESV
jgi:RecB family exonuclease/CTP:molybdopterin cytidylyltransferase MocA